MEQFRVRIAAELPAQRAAVWLAGPEGILAGLYRVLGILTQRAVGPDAVVLLCSEVPQAYRNARCLALLDLEPGLGKLPELVRADEHPAEPAVLDPGEAAFDPFDGLVLMVQDVLPDDNVGQRPERAPVSLGGREAPGGPVLLDDRVAVAPHSGL